MQLSHPLLGKIMAETGSAKWRVLNPVLVHFNATIVNNIWFKKMNHLDTCLTRWLLEQ